MAAELPVPVLKPNEAMFHAAVSQGTCIGMLATFGPAVGTMTDEFDDYVRQTGAPATLTTVLVEDAMTALRGATPRRTTGCWPRAPASSPASTR